MITWAHDRPFLHHRSQRADSAFNNQLDQDDRHYRYLVGVYSDNLNLILKKHQDCLGGMEYCPKVKISLAENKSLAPSLNKIWKKHYEKLLRTPNARNAFTRNSYSQFVKRYRGIDNNDCGMINSGDLTTQPPEEVIPTSNNYINCFSSRKCFQTASYSSDRRPSSSKRLIKRDKDDSIQVAQIFQSQVASIPLKMKTISVAQDPRSKKEQYFLGNGSRQRSNASKAQWRVQLSKDKDQQEFIFEGNQIMIKERRKIYASEIANPKLTVSVKFWGNRVNSIKQCRQRQIDYNPKSQLQRKIMMANCSLAVNPLQMQGYAPKSRTNNLY